MSIDISVCICTYKRPSLKETLNSLENQIPIKGFLFDIYVIDNDPKSSAKEIVDYFKSYSKINVYYYVETEQGVSNARNLCIQKTNSKFIAFIDDDEVAQENWLQELIACKIKFNANVVIGKVVTVYPTETPDWIIKGDFFSKPVSKTGQVPIIASTSNALIERSILPVDIDVFNKSFNQTGGEDTDLFFRIMKLGASIVQSEEAVVHETIDSNRVNKSFLLKKAKRVGETYFKIILNEKPFFVIFLYTAKASLQALLFKLAYLIIYPFDSVKGFRYLIRYMSNKGKLSCVFKRKNTIIYNQR